MKKTGICLLQVFIYFQLYAQPGAARDSAAGGMIKKDSAAKGVEIESKFPGGDAAWARFLSANLVYPSKAVRKKVEGTVIVQFIVDKEGVVSDVQAISGPDLLRDAAVEVFKKSPKWEPAFQYGRKVKSYKKQPVVFRLQ
ncbi:MAG TPA: energy transducer TonB [Puia sp.]|nr:energy transducer TonB [Puia sp.]